MSSITTKEATMTNATHPIFQALADALCPPDEGRLGKHLDSVEEIEAAPAPDDLIPREYVIREIDRRIAFWTQKLNPNSAWYQGDIIKLATLRQLREFVNELEGV
jgi:hypothetical protein